MSSSCNWMNFVHKAHHCWLEEIGLGMMETNQPSELILATKKLPLLDDNTSATPNIRCNAWQCELSKELLAWSDFAYGNTLPLAHWDKFLCLRSISTVDSKASDSQAMDIFIDPKLMASSHMVALRAQQFNTLEKERKASMLKSGDCRKTIRDAVKT